jgi:hypothetical protein
MKKRGLLILTVFTVLLTGVVASYAGWFSGSRAGRSGAHHLDPRSHAKARDVGLTDAAWRYRRCQPLHWRAMFLQH